MDYTELLKKLSKSQIDPELLERINNLGKDHRDPLTGLLDFRSFSWQLEEKLNKQKQFSLIAISIDFLQELNLISGWVVWDLALCGMASLLETLPTPEGLAGRVSGATFMVYFPQTDITLIRKWLGDVSQKLSAFEFPGLDMFPEGHLTLSAGIFCNTGSLKVEEGIKESKQRLQTAERRGGNSIVVLSEKQAVMDNTHAHNVELKIRKKESERWQKSVLVELSLNGLSIVEKTPFLVRENLEIQLLQPEIKNKVKLFGIVVWRKPADNQAKHPEFCLGIKFTNLEKEHMESLEQIMTGVNRYG